MTESELCQKAIAWLQSQHWDVYQEVQVYYGGAIHDMVAVRDRLIWVLEAKTSFGLSVIQQAHGALHHAHLVSVVVPCGKRSRSKHFGEWVCRDMGIGVVTVDKSGWADCIHGRLFRPRKECVDRLRSCLLPEMQTGEYGEAGNNNGSRWTPYRNTMNEVKRFLKENGPATIKEIMDHIEHHYSSDASAKGAIPKALRQWEDWAGCRSDKKPYVYYVRDSG